MRTERARNSGIDSSSRSPIIGGLIHTAIIERFCRLLASMTIAGVALPEAIAVTTAATNNAVFRNRLTEARAAMMRGEGLAGPLAATGLFPGAARQMFAVGESTGNLDDQLQAAANYLDRELDYKIKRFTTFIEPAVIIGRRPHRRLRRHRPGVGHVRDLQPGQRRLMGVSATGRAKAVSPWWSYSS